VLTADPTSGEERKREEANVNKTSENANDAKIAIANWITNK
jgi:hypothetical protein